MALEIVSAANGHMCAIAPEHPCSAKPAVQAPHRALQLPEIMRLILAYALAQPLDPLPTIPGSNGMHIHPSDKWTAQWWIPLLVCKAWHLLGQDLALRKATWNHDHDISLTQLSTSTRGPWRLVLYAPDSWSMRETRRSALNESIDNLVTRLTGDSSEAVVATTPAVAAGTSTTTTTTTPSLCSRAQGSLEAQPRRSSCVLREISFRGDFSFDNELTRFLNNNTIAQSLTLLELLYTDGISYFDFDITTLFGSSKGADGSGTGNDHAPRMVTKTPLLPHLQHLLIEYIHLAQVPPEWTPAQPLLLKTLRMSRIRTDNVSLETLLAGLCGPCLEDLEVTMIALPPQEQLTYPTRPYLQNPATLRQIATACPRLHSIKLQQTLETRAFDALREIYRYFPMVYQASLVSSKGQHQQLAGLYQMTRHLTKLVVSTKALQASQEIHAFLCSDVAEPLEELRLQGAQYAVNLIMPRAPGPSSTTGSSNSSTEPDQRLWKCRHLKVLTIAFESHSPEGYVRDYDRDAQARQVFAFLTTHCSELRFLDIKSDYCITPETGLCFLSRLANLESLVLRTSVFRCRVRSIPSASSSSSSSGHSSPGSSTSSLIPSLTRSRTPSAQDSTRWMMSGTDLSTEEYTSLGSSGLSSLKLCRRIAKLDGQRGHFSRGYGQGILRPLSKGELVGASVTGENKGSTGGGRTRWLSGQSYPPQPELPTGACWRKLSTLMVQFCGFHGDSHAEMEHEVRLFGQLMPLDKVIFTK